MVVAVVRMMRQGGLKEEVGIVYNARKSKYLSCGVNQARAI